LVANKVEQPAIWDTVVDLETPLVTEAVEVVSVTNDAPPIYQVGITIVTWTAVDAANNAGTATQIVEVTPLSKQTAKQVLQELKRQKREFEKQFKADKKALERTKKEAEKKVLSKREIRRIKDKAERKGLLAKLRVEKKVFKEQFRSDLRALKIELK
jgi:hypothetical protein